MADRTAVPKVGDSLAGFDIEVTQERVQRYADASGDHNPIHLDAAFAASTPFGGTIAHGMLLLAYVSRLLTEHFGMAWLQNGVLDARFRSPAPVGARVVVSGNVKSVTPQDDGTMVECAVQVADAAGQTLVTATARMQM